MCVFVRNRAASMITAALMMRLFVGMTVDFTAAHNASWMCPLLGFIIFIPVLFALRMCTEFQSSSSWEQISGSLPRTLKNLFSGVFSLLFAYDAASVLRLGASSSNIIALGDDTVHLLVVPLGIVIAVVILLGGDALGDSARIALRILPLPILIVILVQIGKYRVGWLTPIFGSGIADILQGSIYCAGSMALFGLTWMIAGVNRGKTSTVRCFLLPAIGVAVLLLMHGMSAPAMPQNNLSRAARIELVLSNGRMFLYPQFVLNILWYGGILYLMCTETMSAAAYLSAIIPKLKRQWIALIIAAAVSAAALFNPVWLKISPRVMGIFYPLIAACIALPLMLYSLKKRRVAS